MRAWQEFIETQRKQLGSDIVDKWLKPLIISRFDACNLYLEAPDSFAALWFEEHIRPKLAHLVNNNKKPIKVHLNLTSQAAPEESVKGAKNPSPTAATTPQWTFDTLHPHSTFDSFQTCEGNLLAHRLLEQGARATCDSALLFNPVYLYGRKGTGKTHLLNAFCHLMRKEGLNAVYVRAETFTEHVVSAIRSGQMQAFRKCYRNLDALVIDDIEVFAKKGATQEEFFHTFNTLHSEGKRLVFAAGLPPKELKFIELRLISRFEWGIVIALEMLNETQMRQALEARAQLMNFRLSEEIIKLLVSTFSSNMKSMMRSLEALVLRAHLHESKLTLSVAKKLLADLIVEEENEALTAVKIIRGVAEHYGIKMEDILGKAQSREATLPRQIAMYLCRTHLKLPFMKIGDIFSRDHSTVICSVRLIEKGTLEKSSELNSVLNAVMRRLEN